MDRARVKHKDRVLSFRVPAALWAAFVAKAAKQGRPTQGLMRGFVYSLAAGDTDGWAFPAEDGRRARRRGARSDYRKLRIPAALRWAVWERDNFTCQRCGSRRSLAVDHVKPESKGGELVLDNLQTLCRSCNSSKGVR